MAGQGYCLCPRLKIDRAASLPHRAFWGIPLADYQVLVLYGFIKGPMRDQSRKSTHPGPATP